MITAVHETTKKRQSSDVYSDDTIHFDRSKMVTKDGGFVVFRTIFA